MFKDFSYFAFLMQDLASLTTKLMGGDLFKLVRDSEARDLRKLTTELLKVGAKRHSNLKGVKPKKLSRKLKAAKPIE
jgi:hypothetical protein